MGGGQVEKRDSVTHVLKTESKYFWAVWAGEKRFEVRRDDRGFAVGDFLILQEMVEGRPTHEVMRVEVKYVLPGGQFGIEPGYCVLGIYPGF